MIPENLKYTKEHEWVKIENDQAVFGITNHAQSELGDITFVEVPEKGTAVKQFETLSVVESVKAASDIYAPLSGDIIDVNEKLLNAPELINKSPYEEGWICKIKISDPVQISNLMDAKAYKQYLEGLKK
ncbi:MAG: glycine cleavage system protein GcvH [Candidatus Omnitrophota bacterium]|nr:MAG: glycine cleavage system protein GcvH [Candidatus Omnitrophota bacterium]